MHAMRYVLAGLFFVAGCGGDGSEPTPSQVPEPISPPPVAIPIALDFSGAFGGGGMATGSFTYDKTAMSLATNVRGLAPNATYPLTSWTFTVTGGAILPSSTFMNGVPGHSAEFCVGTCVFSAAPVIELSFLNDAGLLLHLTFDLLDPTPFDQPASRSVGVGQHAAVRLSKTLSGLCAGGDFQRRRPHGSPTEIA